MSHAILISGSSTGIGYAIANKAASLGYHVYAGYRKPEDGERLQSLGLRVQPVLLDVTKPETIQSTVQQIEEERGSLDILVNNAGIVVAGPLACLPLSAIEELFAVNVFGALALTQAALPLLKRGTNPKIFQISSISGRMTIPLLGPYCASKFALESLSDALRVELKPYGIQVCLIEPGSVKTPIWEKSHQRFEHLRAQSQVPCFDEYEAVLRRLAELSQKAEAKGIPPEKVAALIIRLAKQKQIPARKVIGNWDAHLQVWIGRWFPDRWKDWLTMKILGFQKKS